MTDKQDNVPDPQETDHEVGEHNVQWLGLDIHNPVFAVSAVLSITFVVVTLLFLGEAADAFTSMRVWITSTFDWLFIILANFFVLFCLGTAFSRLGRVRLGGPNAKPRYGYPGWLAMLFAAGVGIGLMFFGVLEPVTHTLNPPIGIDPADTETARAVGMAAAITHWGLQAWAIYAVVGLSLAFFCFNQGLPLTLRSAFYPLIGNRVWGPIGHCIDITAVLSTLFGLAVSLGYGAEQIAGGLNYLFDIPTGSTTKILLIIAIIAIALVSVVAGLDKGVKRLSELNMLMAGMLLLFVLIAGPTLVILTTMGNAVIDYVRYLPALSNWVGREDTAFFMAGQHSTGRGGFHGRHLWVCSSHASVTAERCASSLPGYLSFRPLSASFGCPRLAARRSTSCSPTDIVVWPIRFPSSHYSRCSNSCRLPGSCRPSAYS